MVGQEISRPSRFVGSTPLLMIVGGIRRSRPKRSRNSPRPRETRRRIRLTFDASGGIGSSPHMAGELLKRAARRAHEPYSIQRREPRRLQNTIGGQIPIMFANLPVALPHVKGGNSMRALANTRRGTFTARAPEIPTVAESGIRGFDTATWSGLYVPAATPRELVKRIHADIYKIMTAPEFQKRMLQQGIDQSEANTPDKHAAFLKTELARWSRVIAEAGVKAE